jgi:biofilm PGA synthesis lipoprotein PgaB
MRRKTLAVLAPALLLLGGLAWAAAMTVTPAPALQPPAEGKLYPPARPIRALQILNLDCKTWEELGLRLEAFKAAGANAVILRVFHNPGDGYYPFIVPAAESGVYFTTGRSPVVADLLGPFCALAHQKGLRVIAWMTTRYADYGGPAPGLGCMAWDPATRAVKPARGFSPLLPEVRERLGALYADLARYPIDGVLLQDDLMLHQTECLNPKARELYFRDTGRTADPARLFAHPRRAGGRYQFDDSLEFRRWRRWENGQLLALAEELRRRVHAVRPRLPVGLNLFYETVTRRDQSLAWFAQDLDATLASDLDFYALMLYHRQMAEELQLPTVEVLALIEKSLRALVGRVDYPQRIWVKAQSVDWKTGRLLPAGEVKDELQRAKALGPLGLVVMPAPPALDLKMVKEIFE